MESKEKAQELILEMYSMVAFGFKYKFQIIINSDDSHYKTAKQCALVAVDEIIKTTPMYLGNLNPKWKFWNDVKKEINNL